MELWSSSGRFGRRRYGRRRSTLNSGQTRHVAGISSLTMARCPSRASATGELIRLLSKFVKIENAVR